MADREKHPEPCQTDRTSNRLPPPAPASEDINRNFGRPFSDPKGGGK